MFGRLGFFEIVYSIIAMGIPLIVVVWIVITLTGIKRDLAEIKARLQQLSGGE